MRRQTNHRKSKLQHRHNVYGYLFTAPWVIGFLFLFLVPFINAVRFSMSQIALTMEGDKGYQLTGVGFRKYQELFLTHPTYRQTLVDSLTEMAVTLPLIVMFSLFAAVLINRRFRGRALVRGIFFLPVILGAGVAALLQDASWTDAILTGAEETTTAVNGLQGSALLSSYLTEIAGAFQVDMIDTVVEMAASIRQVIQSSGVQILIFLAGLQSIPASMFEASRIEGATAWEAFWKITFPMISPIILVNIVYTVVDTFTNSGNKMMKLIEDTALFQKRGFVEQHGDGYGVFRGDCRPAGGGGGPLFADFPEQPLRKGSVFMDRKALLDRRPKMAARAYAFTPWRVAAGPVSRLSAHWHLFCHIVAGHLDAALYLYRAAGHPGSFHCVFAQACDPGQPENGLPLFAVSGFFAQHRVPCVYGIAAAAVFPVT